MNDKNKLLSMFEIVNNFSLKIEEIILIVITIGLSAVIFIEVICRYIFLIPTAWSEELARYLLYFCHLLELHMLMQDMNILRLIF